MNAPAVVTPRPVATTAPITSRDLYVQELEATLHTMRARLDRRTALDAQPWESNADMTLADLAELLNVVPTAPEYATLGLFVDGYLIPHHTRQVTDTYDFNWCPEWWRHKEALDKFGELWRVYEHFRRRRGVLDMSDFFSLHVVPHMRELLDPKACFKYCSVRNGHKDLLQPMPSFSHKAPPGLYPADHVQADLPHR